MRRLQRVMQSYHFLALLPSNHSLQTNILSYSFFSRSLHTFLLPILFFSPLSLSLSPLLWSSLFSPPSPQTDLGGHAGAADAGNT